MRQPHQRDPLIFANATQAEWRLLPKEVPQVKRVLTAHRNEKESRNKSHETPPERKGTGSKLEHSVKALGIFATSAQS
jgi:hypothetical protein